MNKKRFKKLAGVDVEPNQRKVYLKAAIEMAQSYSSRGYTPGEAIQDAAMGIKRVYNYELTDKDKQAVGHYITTHRNFTEHVIKPKRLITLDSLTKSIENALLRYNGSETDWFITYVYRDEAYYPEGPYDTNTTARTLVKKLLFNFSWENDTTDMTLDRVVKYAEKLSKKPISAPGAVVKELMYDSATGLYFKVSSSSVDKLIPKWEYTGIKEHVIKPRRTSWKDEDDFEDSTGTTIMWTGFVRILKPDGNVPHGKVIGEIKGYDEYDNWYQANFFSYLDYDREIAIDSTATEIYDIKLMAKEGISEHVIKPLPVKIEWVDEEDFFKSTGKVIDWYDEDVTDEDYDEGRVIVSGTMKGRDDSSKEYVAEFTGILDSDYDLRPETVYISNIKLDLSDLLSEHIVKPKSFLTVDNVEKALGDYMVDPGTGEYTEIQQNQKGQILIYPNSRLPKSALDILDIKFGGYREEHDYWRDEGIQWVYILEPNALREHVIKPSSNINFLSLNGRKFEDWDIEAFIEAETEDSDPYTLIRFTNTTALPGKELHVVIQVFEDEIAFSYKEVDFYSKVRGVKILRSAGPTQTTSIRNFKDLQAFFKQESESTIKTVESLESAGDLD